MSEQSESGARQSCGSAVVAVLSVGALGPVTPQQLLSENAQLRAQLATGARRLVSAALLTECIHCTIVLAIRNTYRTHYWLSYWLTHWLIDGSVTG